MGKNVALFLIFKEAVRLKRILAPCGVVPRSTPASPGVFSRGQRNLHAERDPRGQAARG